MARIVEELKAVGEEIGKALPPGMRKRQDPRNVDGIQRRQRNSNAFATFSFQNKEENASCWGRKVNPVRNTIFNGAKEEKINLLKKIRECQKELSKKQLIIKKRYREVQGLERKAAKEIELLRKLQIEAFKLNKELEKLKSKNNE